MGNGYFTNFVTPFVESDQRRSSFGGIEFVSQLADDEDLRGNILVAQSFDSQVVVMFDSITRAQITMLEAINGSDGDDRILEVKNDHLGNLLVAGQLGRVTLVTVATTPTDPVDPTDLEANAAGDYVAAAGDPTNTLAAPPTGWSYLGSDAANGGAEFDLVAEAVGNQGPAYQGFVGMSNVGTAAVYGTNTASPNQFEIFGNGDLNNAVVGTDLLLHPGGGEPDSYVIVRYTVSDPEGTLVPNSGSVSGSFRELITPNNLNANNAGSVDVFVYQNSSQLFLFDSLDDLATGSVLSQADGTFSLTGLTLADGDTIDFVVFNNGNFGADETALQASITADRSDGVLLGDCDCNGEVNFLDITPFIGFLSSTEFKAEADIDMNGEINFSDIAPFIEILSGS